MDTPCSPRFCVFSPNQGHELLVGEELHVCHPLPCHILHTAEGHIKGPRGLGEKGHLPPTLECLNLVDHQVPGLVDVAEKLVVVGLWVREEPSPSVTPRVPTPTVPNPCPQVQGLRGHPG